MLFKLYFNTCYDILKFVRDNLFYIEEIKLLLKYYSFELDDWQDNDWLIEVLKLFLDEEREV